MGSRNDRITTLSGGNQQKVLIGRGFATNPEIMILNDPARGVDVGAKAELYKHLSAFAAQGRAVVYMSSELEEFIGFCSRVLVFRNGGLFDVYNAPELDSAAILASMFGQAHNGGGSQSARSLADADGAESGRGSVGRIKIREFTEPFIRRFDETPPTARFEHAPFQIKIVEFEDGEPVVSKARGDGVRREVDVQRSPRV
jgi:ABC-type multidrug transport system ATPase subunit